MRRSVLANFLAVLVVQLVLVPVGGAGSSTVFAQSKTDWTDTPKGLMELPGRKLTAETLLENQETIESTIPPMIEHSSLLDAFTCKFRGERGLGQTGGRMILNQKHDIVGAFFPKDAKLVVNLHKAGNGRSLYRSDCHLQPSGESVFTLIRVIEPEGFTFQEQGDYELRFSLNDNVISVMPFNVFFKKSKDAFDNKTYTFVDGDWSNLAYLSFSSASSETPLMFHTWTRKVVFSTTPKPSKMDVTLLQGDETVAVTAQGTVAWPEWQSRETTFSFPDNQGGQVFNGVDLLKRSGMHTVRVDLDGKPHQFFNFEVRDGMIVSHPRQNFAYKEPARILCPRKIRLGLEQTSNIFWMERSQTAATSAAKDTVQPGTSKNSRWTVRSDIKPNRPFQLKKTGIRMRKDMPYSIGDGIVAYATGRQGVGYFMVGQDKPLSIKNGQQFRGDLFFACGKLIVLATRNNITVYSTENGRSVEIPDDEIHLSYQAHALYGPRMADASGYLVATVNEPAGLKSKSIVNVVDLSGDNKPIVLPIKNSDFELRDISSIKVDAASGLVAVGSKRRSAIYVANVEAGATFSKYDLSGFDSFGESDMVLTGSHIVYTDAAGFANVRLLDLDSGDVSMPNLNQFAAGWGPVGASNGKRVAWAIKEPRNAWAIGDLGSEANTLPNTNTKSPNPDLDSYGKLGSGRSMGMADDGTVFLGGTRSISTSNCLQASQDDQWQMVVDSQGKPIPAIDVIAGNSMVVFKTGKPSTSSEVTIAYATFGSKVVLPEPKNRQMESIDDKADDRSVGENKSDAVVDSNIQNEIDQERLRVSIETEKTIFDALKLTLSEADARSRARETVIKGLNESGHAYLIEQYKKSWK